MSAKALRLYEERGLLTPARNEAGWRSYGPSEMIRGSEIVALRALGLSLSQVARVLQGNADGLESALAAHQANLEVGVRQLTGTIEKLRQIRKDVTLGRTPTVEELTCLSVYEQSCVEFELPWPGGGERFVVPIDRPLSYIVGPLGSGKTKLALCLAQEIPGAAFISLDRLQDGSAAAKLEGDPEFKYRVDIALQWLIEDGAIASDALTSLITVFETEGPTALVVDLVEQSLEQETQQALIAHLRRRGVNGRPLYLLTRSSAILDLAAVGSDELIIFCPANHSPPTIVAPYPGAAGYEGVATCLASPDVRARTQGVIAWRPTGT